MKTVLNSKNSDKLILLFSGWGMDERPFVSIESDCDVLHVFDYNDLNFDFNFAKYKQIVLISFSAGVFMSAYVQDKLPKLDMKIAVNGTLKLFDPDCGLPQSSCSMMANVNEKNYLELRKKLIYNKKHLAMFNKNQPLRDIKSSVNEISALKKYYSTAKKLEFVFDKVIIGQNDQIIPFANQFRAWTNHKNKRIIQGGHFLFYNFKSIQEIIDL